MLTFHRHYIGWYSHKCFSFPLKHTEIWSAVSCSSFFLLIVNVQSQTKKPRKNALSLCTLLEMDVNETSIEHHAVSVNTPESLISTCMLIDHADSELSKTPYSTWCLSFSKSDTKTKVNCVKARRTERDVLVEVLFLWKNDKRIIQKYLPAHGVKGLEKGRLSLGTWIFPPSE